MELLLNRKIDGLGRVGDVVEVKSGYARNFLLPLGYAIPVTKANMAQIEKARKQALQEEAERVTSLKEMAAGLNDASITIESKANEEGHLFGSVNAAQISAGLREKGFPVDEKMVRLESPIKEIGVFDVHVHLHGDVEAVCKVWVVQTKPA